MNSAAKIIKYVGIALAFLLIFNILFGIWSLGNAILDNEDNIFSSKLEITDLEKDATGLIIDLKGANLEIKSGSEIKIENANKDVEIKEDGKSISIKEKKFRFFKKSSEDKVVIILPIDMAFDQAVIKTGAGKVYIENLIAEKLSLKLGAGSLEVENLVSTDKASIEGGAGKVIIKNAIFNDLDLEVGVGSCNMNAELNGKTDIESGIGKLNVNVLGNKEDYTIEIENGVGAIVLDGENIIKNRKIGNGKRPLKIEGGIGSIDLRFIND